MLEPDKEPELEEELEAPWFSVDWVTAIELESLELLEPMFVEDLDVPEPECLKELECKDEPKALELFEPDKEWELVEEGVAPWFNKDWEAVIESESLE